jgi:3-deoxy-D-arabino-heptulosonate 7-phosphate (DAHP) synthase
MFEGFFIYIKNNSMKNDNNRIVSSQQLLTPGELKERISAECVEDHIEQSRNTIAKIVH